MNIIIKQLNLNNLNDYYKIINNKKNFFFDEFQKKNKNTLRKNILQNIESENIIRFGIFQNKKLIGFTTLGNINFDDWSATFHICIDKNYQGNGFSKIVLTKIINYSFNILNLNKIFLDVHKDNVIAINLYIKFNFLKYNEQNNYIYMVLENNNK